MQQTILIVPGLAGSAPEHWQSWMETQRPEARRVRNIDWDAPVLARWAAELRCEIDAAGGVVWIVAHSYGCLAAVVAAADRADKVAGLLLVAPAEPERFTAFGLREPGDTQAGLGAWIPSTPIGVPSIVVASRNDPWTSLARTAHWAECWGSLLVDAGMVGHINIASGHGPWPAGLRLLDALQSATAGLPLGRIDEGRSSRRGKRGALARLRQRTRFDREVLLEPP